MVSNGSLNRVYRTKAETSDAQIVVGICLMLCERYPDQQITCSHNKEPSRIEADKVVGTHVLYYTLDLKDGQIHIEFSHRLRAIKPLDCSDPKLMDIIFALVDEELYGKPPTVMKHGYYAK